MPELHQTHLDWAPMGHGEWHAFVTRPSDGVAISVSLEAPDARDNFGGGWTWSIGWDTGEDPYFASDAHVVGTVDTRERAERAAAIALQAVLVQGNGEEEVHAAVAEGMRDA